MSRVWTSKPHFRGERMLLKGKQQGSGIALLCALLLCSCGPSPSGYSGGPTAGPTETLSPVAAPPGAQDRPPAPGTTGAPKTADGLPALQAKGNNTALFSEKISSEVARLDRLENAVQELRNDFDSMAPAIVRLVSIEKDIQNLLEQLEVLTGNAPAPTEVPSISEDDLGPQGVYPNLVEPLPLPEPPVAQETPAVPPVSAVPAPETSPPPAPVAETPPAQAPVPVAPAAPAPASAAPADIKPTSSGPAVLAMRVGEHPGKTRIVLDVRGKTSFTSDLDKAENILVVELPEAAWNAEAQKSFSASPLISSYRVEPMNGQGSLLVIQLKADAVISYKGTINNPDGGQRIVIDIASAN